MIEPSLQLGGGNWANKSNSLLGYHKDGANFYADELNFSRNSLGSYTDANGLIQSMPYNLLTYSEDFLNVSWYGNNYITANYGISPDGTKNASRCLFTGANQVLSKSTTLQTGVSCSATIYIKGTSGETINLAAGGADTLQTLNGEWQRIETNKTSINSTFVLNTFSGATARDFLIYGAQLNQGSTALPYFATTTRLNLARVDYKDNINGSLLLEPQRTNLVTYSEDFSNAAWTKANATVSQNQAVSPDGTQNADLIYPSISGSNFGTYQNTAGVTGVVGTVSCYVKSAGKNWALLGTDNGSSYNVSFDLVNGVVGSVPTGYTATIESVGNGWYRITATFQSGYSQAYPFIGLADNTNRSVTADGTNGIYIWGFQTEIASYVSSYIKSEGAATTRLADSCSKTGISDKIGQAEGVVFMDFTVDTISAQTSDPVLWYMKDGGAGERYVELYSNGNLVYLESNGSTIASITKTALAVGRHKCAIAYKNNDMVFYVDGVLIGTDVSGTPSGFSTFGLQYYISTYTGQQKVNQALIFKTRLTNAELATLTTL